MTVATARDYWEFRIATANGQYPAQLPDGEFFLLLEAGERACWVALIGDAPVR